MSHPLANDLDRLLDELEALQRAISAEALRLKLKPRELKPNFR